ncbi:MAG: TatD family hydrolase [Patescibacteria group bacterium]
MKYFDAHSHIHGKEFDADRSEAMARMREAGVSTITVGTYLESSRKAAELAEREPDIWATVGLHPTDTDEDFDEKEFNKLAEYKKVVGIGECGLDYFRLTTNPSASLGVNDQRLTNEKKEIQKENFRKQIELALAVNKPLMIHSRPSRGTMDAYEDVLETLTYNLQLTTHNLRGNIHFFVGDKIIAKQFLDLGFTISFAGVITFARDYDEVIKYIPLESILSETDCPYVSPVPYRGKRNEPAYVAEVVKKIAEIKNLPIDKVSEALFKNAERVFLNTA